VAASIFLKIEPFAEYGFNKSHAAAYAIIAYQTAYLKAHYPAEYMASVLSNNMRDIKSVSFFMDECKRAGIKVLSPDINESFYKFAVNKEGAIRFGMGAIKGVGANAVAAVVAERKENGNYKSIFDVAKRIDLRSANKKAFDGLILAGAFDSFEETRAQYFELDERGVTFIERAIRFGNKFQENKNSAQVSLFGEASEVQFDEPIIPDCEPWGIMEKLSKEKEVIGMYISGHPLDDYKTEIKYFCNAPVSVFANQVELIDKDLTIGGIITDVQHRISKNGKGWAAFTIEDYSEAHEFRMFGEDYLKFKHFLIPNSFLHIKISVRKGWREGDVRIQFNAIQMLQDVLETLANKLTLQLNIDELNEKRIDAIEKIVEDHKGKDLLNFVVYDMEEKMKLHMPSRSSKVKISQELLDELETQELLYKLN